MSHQCLEFIPRIPFGVYDTPEKLDGLIAFFEATGIRKLQVVPIRSPEPAFLSREALIRRRDELAETYRKLEAHGIEGHMCVLRTFMPARGGGHAYKQLRTDLDGKTRQDVPCPIDPDFIEYLRFMYTELAKTGTRSMVVDDDFRYQFITGLGATCFCPLHIDEFNRRYTHSVDFDSLTGACRESEPSTVKQDWMACKRDLLEELAAELRDVVHAVEPAIRVGLMLTSTYIALADLRDPGRLVEILAGDNRSLVRPGQGSYSDHDRTILLQGLADTALQASLMPDGCEIQAEVDLYPHSRFNKSAVYGLSYQVKSNLALGLKTVNIWPFDNRDTICASHPYAGILNRQRDARDTVSSLIPDDSRLSGVEALCSPQNGLIRSHRREDVEMYGPQLPVLLWRYGIAFTYQQGETAILTRESLPLAPKEFEEILDTRNCLLDLDALRWAKELELPAVVELELGEAVDPRRNVKEERLDVPDTTSDRERVCRSSSVAAAELRALSDRFLSLGTFTDAEDNPTSPSVLFSEEGGRRLGVMAYPLRGFKGHFLEDESKQAHIQSILARLHGSPLPATVIGAPDVCPTLLVSPSSQVKILSLINRSTAPAEDFEVTVGLEGDGADVDVAFVDDCGVLREFPEQAIRREGRQLQVRVGEVARIQVNDVLFLKIEVSA